MAKSIAAGERNVLLPMRVPGCLYYVRFAASLELFSQYSCCSGNLLQQPGQSSNCSMGELHQCAASVCKNLSATGPKQVRAFKRCATVALLFSVCLLLTEVPFVCALLHATQASHAALPAVSKKVLLLHSSCQCDVWCLHTWWLHLVLLCFALAWLQLAQVIHSICKNLSATGPKQVRAFKSVVSLVPLPESPMLLMQSSCHHPTSGPF